MEKIKSLNGYQKGLLIFMTVMTLIFAIIYPITISRVGYRYKDAILVPIQDNGKITYTGKIQGKQAGNIIDRMEPSAATIYELLNEPELTHKGEPLAWFGTVFICILNALTMLFADELFRWNLVFQIRNVEKAEPSDWEIAQRYIVWTVMAIMALVLFIIGLQ